MAEPEPPPSRLAKPLPPPSRHPQFARQKLSVRAVGGLGIAVVAALVYRFYTAAAAKTQFQESVEASNRAVGDALANVAAVARPPVNWERVWAGVVAEEARIAAEEEAGSGGSGGGASGAAAASLK